MHECNCLLLVADRKDVLLHVDCVSSEFVLDELVVLGYELVALTVEELGTGTGTVSSCGLMVWRSLIVVMWAKK